MTAAAVRWPDGASAVPVPPLRPALRLVRGVLVVVLLLSGGLVLELALVGALQQRAAQQRAYDQLRAELAQGTAPLGGVDDAGRPWPGGTPVAYLEIPSIGLRQAVVEGTAGADLVIGPGHRRGTPLPGQAGVSVLHGRRAAFGGPFARLHELAPGATVRVTTGQGVHEYRVTGLRRAGEPAPPPLAPGRGGLLLATADGRPFVPTGALRVDAELAGPAAAPPDPPSVRAGSASEPALAGDGRALWALASRLLILLPVALAAVWGWHRWGRAQAWLVFLPPALLVGTRASVEAARLLPNLL